MADTDLFKALGEPLRHRLLQVLSSKELTVSELVEVLDQPQSTISRHLKVLRDAELLVDRRSGPATFYSARPAGENGNGQALGNQLLRWVGQQALEPALEQRVHNVLGRRQGGGGFFEAVGSRWDQLRIEAFGECFHLEALMSLLPTQWTVADIGTGTGYLLPILAGHFQRVIAVDPAANMLDLARSRLEAVQRSNVEFRAGSLEQLPINEGELDLAIASLVLHHVSIPRPALGEVERVIKPGGRLLLIEQHTHGHQGFHDRMGDVHSGFDPDELIGWVRSAGFSDIRVHPLATVRPSGRNLGEVPSLFAITAAK